MRFRHGARRAAAVVALAVAAAVALAGCSNVGAVELETPAQVDGSLPDATQQRLQDAVAHSMTAAGASGAIVGVWAPWSGSWVAGLGTQDVGGGAPITADMQFRVAQLTRPMTCDVLYALAAEGRVQLGDSVSMYVAGVADLGDVTLAQLCDSTSGIGAYASQLLPLWIANPTRAWNPRELASYGLGQPRTTKPGEDYRASDAGYVLLGIALERAAGMSATELYEHYVAEPLGLVSTRLPRSNERLASGMLHGHVSLRDGEGVMNCTEPVDMTMLSSSAGFTDSGVISDIHDLHRYTQALASGALLPEGVDRFADPKPVDQNSVSWYNTAGGALMAGPLIGQLGSVPGYSTAAFTDPETGLSVAVVLNNSGGGFAFAQFLAWELAAIASKAPAAAGETAPEAGLPWTAETYNEATATAAICTAPAE